MQVYLFSFRQEQLAKLTPSELIETAYLSSLLEQRPHTTASHSISEGFSHRFDTLRTFLIEIVRVVPIESLVHAISVAEEVPIALQCCRQMMTSNAAFPPSITMIQSLCYGIEQLISNGEHAEQRQAKLAKPNTFKEAKMWYASRRNDQFSSNRSGRRLTRASERLLKERNISTSNSIMNNIGLGFIYSTLFVGNNYYFLENLTQFESHPYETEISFLRSLFILLSKNSQLNAIVAVSDINLKDAYPVIIDGADKQSLKSPLQMLIAGRKVMQWLVKASSQIIIDSNLSPREPQKLSQLYNSKMLEKVNEIRKNTLAVCTLLLGAFMEEQIRVPLMKTSFDTARAIEIATSTAALGVWALFSLSLGDVKATISSIPSRSFVVEVTEYIKGIFKQETSTADENYAGKLQFIIQGMNDRETVSCNSHYVSYSLERQLIELCAKLKIDESTPLETLVHNWDHIFKDNVMSFVVPTHRSLIARWLKWALMIHHLREELACYTAIGVVGLVNSGKSLLVSTLFDIKVLPEPACLKVCYEMHHFQFTSIVTTFLLKLPCYFDRRMWQCTSHNISVFTV